MGKRRRRKSIVPSVRTIKESKRESSQSQVRLQREESLSDWEDRVRKQGIKRAEALIKGGRKLDVMILAPTEVRGGDTVQLARVITKPDWKIVAKHELVDLATEFISKAYLIGLLDTALPKIFSSIIEERGIYEYNIGEFFLLYGMFEQKYGLSKSTQTMEKMLEFIGGEEKSLKVYVDRKKTLQYPLPYAVKNILSHIGNNPNSLTEEELKDSVDLLKKWVSAA